MVPARKGHEASWAHAVQSGKVAASYRDLRERWALPLEEKISLSLKMISCWYESWSGDVAVSFSGGKDSTVLLWLVRCAYPEVPAVFANTGLEYPEIVSFVKSTPNVEIVRPKMPFHQVIQKYGYPMVSKKVARGIAILRNPTGRNDFIVRLYDKGINRFEEKVNGFRVPDRWRFLVKAPFMVSDHCCSVMKKEPMRRYSKRTGRVQFVGTLAADSKARQRAYLQHGCNAYDLKEPKSTPLGFWTQQDVLSCIAKYKIPHAPVYGRIRRSAGGAYSCTGVSGTGCVFCGFGLQMEKPPTRFQRLAITHPKLHRYCMDKLGLREVLGYMRENLPRHLRPRFEPSAHQMSLGEGMPMVVKGI